MKKITLTKILVIAIYIILNINSTNAYTNVSGTITTSTGWTLGGSPYVVNSDLTISSGVTLTIEPGVVVKVKPMVKIVSNGVIDAQGTIDNYIYFTAFDDTSVESTVGDGNISVPSRYGLGDYWKSLQLNGAGSSLSILKYVKIKYYGNTSINSSDSYSSRSRTSRCRLRTRYYSPTDTNRSGLQLYNSDARIDSIYILNGMVKNTAEYGDCSNYKKSYEDNNQISVSSLSISGGNPEIINNRIESSKKHGIYVGSGGAHIKNNTIISSAEYGIYYNDGTSIIENNDIQNNGIGGINVLNGTPTIRINQILNNTSNGINISNGSPNINNNYLIKGQTYGINISGGTPNINNNINKPDETSVAVISGNTNAGINISGGSPIINTNRIEGNNTYGISLSNGTATLTNNTIKVQTYGVYQTNGNHIIDANNITNNTSHGVYLLSGTANVKNNSITNNSSNGIYITACQYTLNNNTISSNNNGIYIDTGTGYITNNLITNNSGYGLISSTLDPYLDGSNNTISGNGNNNYTAHQFNITGTSGTMKAESMVIYIDRTSSLTAGKTLTLLPGNTIKFSNGVNTTIFGTLISEGTSSKKITFTSINDGAGTPVAGNWDYFKISGTTSNSTSIKYSEFKYGNNALSLYNTSASVLNSNFTINNTGIYADLGTANIANNTFVSNINYGIYVNAGTPIIDTNNITGGSYGIRVINNNPQIKNNNISGASTNGIYIDNGSPIIDNNQVVNNLGNGININEGTCTITNNTITGNTLYGLITTYLDPYHDSNSNIISSNGQNGYYVHYFNLNILTSGTFDFSEQELVVDRTSTLSAGKEVILNEGSIIKIKNNINIKSDGVIKANGTSDSKVIFTSINDNTVGLALGSGSPQKGNWQYLQFNGAGSNGSILDNVELRYAGAYGVYILTSSTTIQNSKIELTSGHGIFINSTAISTIQNNIIQNNNNDGINLAGGNHIIDNNNIKNNLYSGIYINSGKPTINNNSINNNSQYAINSYNLQIRVGANEVNEANTSTGNLLGQYASRSVDIVDTTGNIDGTKSDVIIIGNGALASGKQINFSAGSIIKAENGVSLNFNGVINANGTAGSKVVFTSINDNTVGQVHGSVTPVKGHWQFVLISGAGSNGSTLDNIKLRYASTYGIQIQNSTSTVKNSTIEQNSGYGIYVNSATVCSIQNNIIQNNNNDGIYATGGNHIIDQNDILNNSNNGINTISGNPVITNNAINNNLYSGIYIHAGKPIISNNEINNNSQYAINSYNLQIRVGENEVNEVNTSTGNILGQYVSRSVDIVDTTGNIDGSKSDVIIIGNGALASGKQINFSAGSIIKAANNIVLSFNGIINTNGTSSSKVVFTSINDNTVGQVHGSVTPVKGHWQYVSINGAGTNGSILDNFELRYAGNYGVYITNSTTTVKNSKIELTSGRGIYISSSPVTTIQNNIIQNNNIDGIYSSGGNHIIDQNNINNNFNNGININTGNPVISNNTISANKYHGITGNIGTSSITNNIIENNLYSGINIDSGKPIISNNEININSQYAINSYNLQIRVGENEVNETNTASGNLLGKYASRSLDIVDSIGNVDGSKSNVIIIGNGYLSSGKRINFAAGSVIKVGVGNYLNSYGIINASGTSTSKIVFTSINDNTVGQAIGTGTPNKGNWQYLFLNSTGTNGSILDNIEQRYGNYGINITNSNAILKNSKIELNSSYGIYINNSYVSTIQDNLVQNNNNDGIYNYSGNNIITGNNVKSNLNNGVYINSGTPNIRNNIMTLNTNYGLIAHNLDPFLSSYGNYIKENGKNTYYAHYFDISGTNETITFNIFIDTDSTLAAGKKLKLFPGTIVKLGAGVDLTILGTLESKGTAVDNIIFTSVNDNSVGPILNTSTPSRGIWGGLNFNNTTSNSSILEYTQIKYAVRGVETTTSNIKTQNVIITESSNYGFYISGGSPIVSNTVIVNNSSYGIYCASGTPNIRYNLLYQNTTANTYNCTTGSGNLLNVNPLFENTVTFKPTDLSPLIGTGDPDLGNHYASGNRYDIGVVETGVEATLKVLKANIIKVGDGIIDLKWTITADPSNGADVPMINNQGTEEINFRVKYKGTYTVKLEALQLGKVIDSATKDFIIK